MISIRHAKKEDISKIDSILDSLYLRYESLNFDNFWVGSLNTQIVSILEWHDFSEGIYLSTFGVHKDFQGQGIAKEMLFNMLSLADKPVYLYTIIPEFFTKFGFKAITNPPSGMPPKSIYKCHLCQITNCQIMKYSSPIESTNT